jgi:Protein of unknown function (DUF4038)/Domain of unknown function (DUF5060)
MTFRSALASVCLALGTAGPVAAQTTHVWQLHEIVLRAARAYPNPYTDVEVWVDLRGPGFAGRVYGFWDGGDVFRVRVVATAPGRWRWTSGSSQPADSGLSGRSGAFTAARWTAAELAENPNRRGFIRATPNGHALEYGDGTPFFLLGDTWLGAATWRLPLTDAPATDTAPGPGVTFQDAVAYRRRQGFNSVSLIAAFPTWAIDQHPATYADSNGVYYRNAWEEFGVTVPGGRATAKGMTDERGYRPFEILPGREGLPDYDRVVPEFFRSLDRKIAFLNAEGFVPILETVRRDVAPPWKAYFDFDRSFARFLEYMIARYGAYSIIFSKVHFDIYLPHYSLTAAQFNEAITGHYRRYGPMPFGQPVTALIDHATDSTFGTGAAAPWITMHSTGNAPRDHGIYAAIERQFRLTPPLPTADLEPHYTGWVHPNNDVNGERPEPNSDRDNYFSRAQMYGCVLSGALAGHVHGTGAYDVTSASEPPGPRPYFWQALRFPSAIFMAGLGRFILSEGVGYRELQLAAGDLAPRRAPGSSDRGLDGWSYQMRTPRRDLGFLYFEHGAERARSKGWTPGGRYAFTWYDPRAGAWQDSVALAAGADGTLQLPAFPGGEEVASTDWAARIVAR